MHDLLIDRKDIKMNSTHQDALVGRVTLYTCKHETVKRRRKNIFMRTMYCTT